MASFVPFDRAGLDYWPDHNLHYYPSMGDGDWQPRSDDDQTPKDPAAYEPDPMAFTSLLERESLQVDLTRWHYDDDAVAGDLEQYRQNLQDIADRISEELSGFEPRSARDRPVPSVERADGESAAAQKPKPKPKVQTSSSQAADPKKKKKTSSSTTTPTSPSSTQNTMAYRPGPGSSRKPESGGRQG